MSLEVKFDKGNIILSQIDCGRVFSEISFDEHLFSLEQWNAIIDELKGQAELVFYHFFASIPSGEGIEIDVERGRIFTIRLTDFYRTLIEEISFDAKDSIDAIQKIYDHLVVQKTKIDFNN